jgi:hypothetical protein
MIDEVHHSGFIRGMGSRAAPTHMAGWCRYFGFNGIELPDRRDANDMLNACRQYIINEIAKSVGFAGSCRFRE